MRGDGFLERGQAVWRNMIGSSQVSPEEAKTGVKGPSALDYAGIDGAFDETLFDTKNLRPHWQSFFAQMDSIGLSELHRRWDEARRLIRENGVTYNVYGDPRGMDRPWELDPVPFLLAPDEAATLEAGLI